MYQYTLATYTHVYTLGRTGNLLLWFLSCMKAFSIWDHIATMIIYHLPKVFSTFWFFLFHHFFSVYVFIWVIDDSMSHQGSCFLPQGSQIQINIAETPMHVKSGVWAWKSWSLATISAIRKKGKGTNLETLGLIRRAELAFDTPPLLWNLLLMVAFSDFGVCRITPRCWKLAQV